MTAVLAREIVQVHGPEKTAAETPLKDVIDFDEKRVGVVVSHPLVAVERVHGALFKRKPILPTAILMMVQKGGN